MGYVKNGKLTEGFRVNFSPEDAQRIIALAHAERRSAAFIIREATLRELREKEEAAS